MRVLQLQFIKLPAGPPVAITQFMCPCSQRKSTLENVSVQLYGGSIHKMLSVLRERERGGQAVRVDKAFPLIDTFPCCHEDALTLIVENKDITKKRSHK